MATATKKLIPPPPLPLPEYEITLTLSQFEAEVLEFITRRIGGESRQWIPSITPRNATDAIGKVLRASDVRPKDFKTDGNRPIYFAEEGY